MTVYGYARVSTAGQSLVGQKNNLKEYGAEIIISEKYTGTTTDRPQFDKLVRSIKGNDTLIVTKLDRFARNTREALNLIDSLLQMWKGYNKLDTKLREIVERFIMARRKFDKQFKNSAVKLILEEGYSVKEVSQELEVHANSLYRWVQEVEEYGESAFPGNGTALANAQHKIKLLEKENRYLQEELELLKKFRVFLKRSK